MILVVFRPKKHNTEDKKQWLSKLLQILEKQYPNAFDEVMSRVLKRSPGGKETRQQKGLRKLLENSMDVNNTLCIFEKLYHPNPQFRKQAIKHLTRSYHTLQDRQKEQIKRYFLDRLNDDNYEVVRETLNVSRKLLPDIIETHTLKTNLIALINRIRTSNNWNNILFPVLKVLCANFESNDVEVFMTLLPYLLPTTDFEFRAAKLIISMKYGQTCELLKPMLTQLAEAKNQKTLFEIVSTNLSNVRNVFDLKEFLKEIKRVVTESSSVLMKYLTVLLLSHFLPKQSNIETTALVTDIFLFHFRRCSMFSVNSLSEPHKLISCAKEDKFPVEGFLLCLQNVILKTENLTIDLTKIDFSQEIAASRFFRTLLEIFFKPKQQIYNQLLDVCLAHFDLKSLRKIEFLLNFCAAPQIDRDVQLKCLHYIQTLLNQEKIGDLKNAVIAYIFVVAYNKEQNFRKAALDLFKIVAKTRGPLQPFLQNVLGQKEEFILDYEQIPLILSNVVDETILKMLVSVASDENMPLYIVFGVLNVLSQCSNVEIFEETSKFALKLLDVEGGDLKLEILQKIIERFDVTIAESLTIQSNIWKFVQKTLKIQEFSVLILNQITRDLFDALPENIKATILDDIIELATTTKNPEVLAASSRIFKHIDLDVTLILKQLNEMRDAQSEKNRPKKRRIAVLPTADILEMLVWRKGVTVLEFLQNKKKIKNMELLVGVLFDVLKKCLDFDEQASVEYPKQLVLSNLLHCCERIEHKGVLEKVVNVELIVQCIRASQNPQTHHHALLLLALVAPLTPTQVLHHIMAIFTFMGSSVLRHDDAYSFQVITKIIDNVIPVLIEDGGAVCKVLRVFVDALLDVPEHRRMPLYKQLLEKIDVEENLFLFLLLVFESHVVHGSGEKQRGALEKYEVTPKRLDVAADLARLFAPNIVITSCIKIIEYLNSLPVDKSDHNQIDESPTFNINYHTPKQFRHYKYTIVVFVSSLLSSKEFVSQIAALPDNVLLQLESLYKDLIVNTLTYIQNTSKIADKSQNTPQAQYWKAMLHYSYEILDSANALLTPQMFLLVTKGLMSHNLNVIRKRSLELLNTKLQSGVEFFKDCDATELHSLITPLVETIKTVENDTVEPEQEVIVQTALLSLKLLVKHLAGGEPQKFSTILTFITGLMKIAKTNENILASVILCLAELCANLRAHAIPGLPKYMPALLKILKSCKSEEKPSLLLLCTITTIQKIVDSLPLFLSPYLEKILCEISFFSAKYDIETDDQKITPVVNKLKNIKQKIGSVIPARVLIPAIEQCYEVLLQKEQYCSVGSLMDVLGECLKNLKPAEFLPDLTNFFLKALEFRSEAQASDEDIKTVETHVIKALTVLVLKLSETSFRPLYYRLYDWAIRNDDKTERIITFYTLSSGIADCLKGLFVLFAGHFINNAASVLDACNPIKTTQLYFEDEAKTLTLLENILKTLNCVFLYDTQTFVTKERFDVLMQPIVDQLENTLGGVQRTKNVLIPCIVNFAVATANDALWKQMNYQILLKMRHSSPEIRLVALECLTETAKRLGEDFLPLLPETIPFLAELLEDEEETVENACQKAVQELEKVLGEPLKKYF